MSENQWPVWEVFIQATPGIPHKHAGNVHATDAEMALQNARDLYGRRNEGINMWVVPATAITASTPEDQGSFFDPANDKPYRHPTFYKIPDGVKYL
ncbi:MAG: 1,2-phenylacetyl-CoA epoxidase subunit B [Bacteroidia bacterium]|jgi:ring-1,2-phenylacetyl-CoA epoxidase subunit PaaB|nr:1,2-phenylacetyl-CoA epoxidase subunit B [Bacteroidia bacterium]